jgi:biopolymer transport protein ExbD
MADYEPFDQPPPEEEEGPVLPHRPVADTAEMDITPMIDIVFLLLIFFLVCSTTAVQSAVELPRARHGTGVSDRSSVILTVQDQGKTAPARVYLSDGIDQNSRLPDDPELQAAAITEAVEQGAAQGKTTVLVKAEKGVRQGEMWRVYTAVGRAETSSTLHVAVLEVE